MDIQDNFIHASAVVSLSYLGFQTEALPEYLKLLKLDKIAKLNEYYCYKITNNGQGNYLDFIKQKKDCFITRLISCPYCLGFWLCLGLSLFSPKFLISYAMFLIMYKLITK